MTDDLVKRLRFWNGGYKSDEKMKRAADHIEKLGAALRMVIDWDNTLDLEDGPDWDAVMGTAHKALEGKDD
jgi:hypothetical protein